MKPIGWPNKSADAKRLNAYKRANLARALKNPNEIWMKERLKVTNYKWTQQARWGSRIYDFWCAKIGVVVEVDGREHKENYDAYRDKFNFLRSGIIVLRVRNKNESDADSAIDHIVQECLWSERRAALGLSTKGMNTKWLRRQLVEHGDIRLGIAQITSAGLYCSYAVGSGSIRQSASWVWDHNPEHRNAYQPSFL